MGIKVRKYYNVVVQSNDDSTHTLTGGSIGILQCTICSFAYWFATIDLQRATTIISTTFIVRYVIAIKTGIFWYLCTALIDPQGVDHELDGAKGCDKAFVIHLQSIATSVFSTV